MANLKIEINAHSITISYIAGKITPVDTPFIQAIRTYYFVPR